MMLEKGWSQSDLAREVWGETEDARGYKVAKGRDRISQYVKGVSRPDPQNLHKIAQVLGTTADKLAPDITAATIDRENPEVALTAVSGHRDKVHVQVNMLLPLEDAAEIVAIVSRSSKKGSSSRRTG